MNLYIDEQENIEVMIHNIKTILEQTKEMLDELEEGLLNK